MSSYFFYGTLRHLPLLNLVLGEDPTRDPDGPRAGLVDARLPGYRLLWAKGQSFPVAVPVAGDAAEDGAEGEQPAIDGVLVTGLTDPQLARLDYFMTGFGFAPQRVEVDTVEGVAASMAYLPGDDRWRTGAAFHYDSWLDRHAGLEIAAAEEAMAHYGQVDADRMAGRFHAIRTRAQARLNARTHDTAASLRGDPPEITVMERSLPYADFFAVEDYRLSVPRHDGEGEIEMSRAVFVSGDAATVLPYDPLRDCVLLVEQFRAGPFARGDRNPMVLEPIAGRVDPGETPEDCARREALEEAGLELGALHEVARYYPSPGAKSEYLYSYIALADLPESAMGVHGLLGETEDIRTHVVSFTRLMELVETGEANTAPLLISAAWLARERERLREG
ncbi:MAG: NUDIX domain-containing protein [Celeribacter sp.]|jgi:nudix-type nucleoside diphosphatase (YffH/AdpP family)